jgi:putative transposase
MSRRVSPLAGFQVIIIGRFWVITEELGGQKAILLWDGLPAHKSRVMKEYLLQQRNWLRVERLPGYAPDLNPVEMLWGKIKGQELANRCPRTSLK